MGSAPLKRIVKIGNLSVWYGGSWVKYRGIHVWYKSKHTRILPFNRVMNWSGNEQETDD